MKLSIIIVNYNVTQLLEECLLSIQKYIKEVDYEVIIVDNDSTDSSWKKLIPQFPTFTFIASENNDGFSKANNKGVRQAKGEYILLLNPDTALEDFQMKTLLDFADQQQNLGCIGVRMHDANGVFLPESKRSLPNFFNSFEKLFVNFRKNNAKSYYRNDIGEQSIAKVEIITGAFLLAKRATYNAIGGLDEAYFMYGEDIDLCYTFSQNGYQNWYYGAMSILHYKGESSVKDEVYLERFYGAMQIFLHKYYKKQSPIQYLFLSLGLQLKHFLEKRKLPQN